MNNSAPTSSLTSIAPSGRPFFFRWLSALADRHRARQSLGQLGEAHLKDVGLTRYDVEISLRAGSSQDFSDRLARKAGCRSGNW